MGNVIIATWEITVHYDEYAPPVVTTITPTIGATAGGTEVVIAGDKFATGNPDTIAVTIGGVACTSIVVDSDDQITCDTPAGSGAGDVVVTATYNTTGLTSGTLSSGFTHADAPTVTDIVPRQGIDTETTNATVTGTGFSDDTPDSVAVTVGGKACTNVVVVSDTSLTCTVPSGGGLSLDVVVTATYTPGGDLSGTGSGLWGYLQASSAEPARTLYAGKVTSRGRIVKRVQRNFFRGWNAAKSRARRPFEFAYSDGDTDSQPAELAPKRGGNINRSGEIKKGK